MRRLIALLATAPIALAACGGSDSEKPASSSQSSSSSSSSSAKASTLKLTAQEPGDEEFAFSPKQLSAKAGKVTISLSLPGDLKAPHGIAIDGGKSGQVVQAGGTSTVTETLKPGKYTFYCPVSDHREEGMEGTLTVE